MAGIGVHISAEYEGLGAEPQRHFHGHGGVDAIATGFIAAGSDYATATHTPDNQGFTFETGVPKALDGDEKGIQVEMEHGTVVHWTKYTSFFDCKKVKIQVPDEKMPD